ncbi:HNH endonuclease family protein [Streptomyces capparidis]
MKTTRRATLAAAAAAAACLAVLPAPAHAEPDDSMPLRTAVATLPVAEESRAGYVRTAFRHWVDADGDGCSTRNEVLLEEAIQAPQVTGRCTLTGGAWHSWYDDTEVTDARGLDIDHLVPLAEAWDSGAGAWSATRRQAYANDLGDNRALVAATARSNRSKADQDPTDWLPDPAVVCHYITDWTAIKHRWDLTVDPAEQRTLTQLAADCPNVPVTLTTPA